MISCNKKAIKTKDLFQQLYLRVFLATIHSILGTRSGCIPPDRLARDKGSAMFSGKRILVTGASSGIGKALAEELATHRTRLGLIARRTQLVEKLAADMQMKGASDAVGISCDVRSREAYDRLLNKTMRIMNSKG
jgi:FlaA1/EpsC-like NDP-sugar epimerase